MNKFIAALFLTFIFTATANASFTNLDFESGRVQTNEPYFGFLEWGIAVPGWDYSDGDDTGTVYYGRPHVGSSQWFLLNDANLVDEHGFGFIQVPFIHQGNYSLSFASGNADPLDPDSPFINASISQTGMVPMDARYIQLLAEGPFEVSVGSEVIPTVSLGEGL